MSSLVVRSSVADMLRRTLTHPCRSDGVTPCDGRARPSGPGIDVARGILWVARQSARRGPFELTPRVGPSSTRTEFSTFLHSSP